MVLQPRANRFYSALYQGGLFDDVDFRVKVSQAQGGLDQPVSIAFWGSDTDNYYVAEMESDGHFAIQRLMNHRWLVVADWATSDAIKQGLGQTNELRIVTQGKLATLYINGQQVASIHGFPTGRPSQIGLCANRTTRSRSGNSPI